MEKMMQITSGQGPVECERVVALLVSKIIQDAKNQEIEVVLVDSVEGSLPGTLYSALLLVKEAKASDFCGSWSGTIQWIAQSPYRKFHKRKNWFAAISLFDIPSRLLWDERDVVYQTMRASGPGGQNVNKVESAVRATHTPSGISVTASSERSQLMNKKIATAKLKAKLISWQIGESNKEVRKKWMEHNTLERGNAVKVFQEPLL